MGFLPQEFYDYLECNDNRSDFIQNWLEKNGVHSDKILLDGKSHVLVQYGSRHYDSRFNIKTVVCHHDRVKGTPGANDNSAANWQIMNWAVRLNSYPEFHNVRILFTDGEELGWNNGVTEQGAFGIARTFSRLGFGNDDVYVFDACGRGEIPILARNSVGKNASSKFVNALYSLEQRTQDILRKASPSRWMTLPVPYSDNASFLACGIPAVAITMLPAYEASLYARRIVSDKYLEETVLNRESSKARRISENIPDYSYKQHLPDTWNLFHTEKDSADSLTEISFSVMSNILSVLASSKSC